MMSREDERLVAQSMSDLEVQIRKAMLSKGWKYLFHMRGPLGLYVAWQKPDSWRCATHYFNKNDADGAGAFYHGHYDITAIEAVADVLGRCTGTRWAIPEVLRASLGETKKEG